MTAANLRAHPAYTHLFVIYCLAISDWHSSDAIQDAARTLGMNARGYADARIVSSQFSWASSNTTGPVTKAHLDIAYEDAVRDVCGVQA